MTEDDRGGPTAGDSTPPADGVENPDASEGIEERDAVERGNNAAQAASDEPTAAAASEDLDDTDVTISDTAGAKPRPNVAHGRTFRLLRLPSMDTSWFGQAHDAVGTQLDRVPAWLRTTVAAMVLAIIGTLAGVQLAGGSTYSIGPLDVNMRLVPSFTGASKIEIPPLGALTIDSHDGPISLNARVTQLDEQETQRLLQNPEGLDQASKDAADDVTTAVRDLVIRACVAALLMAALLGLLAFRSLPKALLTAGVTVALLAMVLGSAWATKRPESIREPHYEGLLSNAPAVVGNAQDITDRYGEYRGSLIKIITNFGQVYSNLSNLPRGYQPDPDTIRVLHISDLHLNPASFDVITPIAQQFSINVIADTGDITDWGTDLENQYADNIGKLNIPYVFVRGNHDKPETGEAVAAQPNAVVLENRVVEVAGLTFAGIGDPRFTPDKSEGDLSKEVDEVLKAGMELNTTITTYDATHPKPVDVAMIHDPAGAPELADAAPVVLSGHTHKRKMRELDEDSILRVEGSTGARGLRGFYEDEVSPMRMSVLYFTKDGVLQAADEIDISGPGQQTVSLNRRIIKE